MKKFGLGAILIAVLMVFVMSCENGSSSGSGGASTASGLTSPLDFGVYKDDVSGIEIIVGQNVYFSDNSVFMGGGIWSAIPGEDNLGITYEDWTGKATLLSKTSFSMPDPNGSETVLTFNFKETVPEIVLSLGTYEDDTSYPTSIEATVAQNTFSYTFSGSTIAGIWANMGSNLISLVLNGETYVAQVLSATRFEMKDPMNTTPTMLTFDKN